MLAGLLHRFKNQEFWKIISSHFISWNNIDRSNIDVLWGDLPTDLHFTCCLTSVIGLGFPILIIAGYSVDILIGYINIGNIAT